MPRLPSSSLSANDTELASLMWTTLGLVVAADLYGMTLNEPDESLWHNMFHGMPERLQQAAITAYEMHKTQEESND